MMNYEVIKKIEAAIEKINYANVGNKYADYIYKDYMFELILYKYLSNKQIEFLEKNNFTKKDIENLKEDNIEVVEYIQINIGYYIEYKNLFSTWIEIGIDFDVSNVLDALSAFNRLTYKYQQEAFHGVFDTLHTRMHKLELLTVDVTKIINELIYLIKNVEI